MAEIRYEYPLKLPNGWQTTPPSAKLHNASFPRNLILKDTLQYLTDEIGHFPYMAVSIYSNYQHLSNERLRKKIGNDPGVSVQIKAYNRMHFIACDRWVSLEQNIYALHLALRACRQYEEWGIASTDFALSLFASDAYQQTTLTQSQPAQTTVSQTASGMTEWMEILGLGPTATLEDANAVYRRRAKDVTGDEEALIKLNKAIESARKHLQ